jgi:ribosomal protein L37AE/L43A
MLETVLNRPEEKFTNPVCPMCGTTEQELENVQLFPSSRTRIEVKIEDHRGVPYYDFVPAHIVWTCSHCGQNVGTYVYAAQV